MKIKILTMLFALFIPAILPVTLGIIVSAIIALLSKNFWVLMITISIYDILFIDKNITSKNIPFVLILTFFLFLFFIFKEKILNIKNKKDIRL